MATRSTIAVQLDDGTVRQIYAHWDGYLDGNGLLLQKYYNTLDLAAELVSLGDISSLAERIHPTSPLGFGHTFDNPEKGVTIYYKRDRGEKGCEPTTYTNFSDYKTNGDSQEYDYVFLNGEWFVRYYGTKNGFVALTTALANETQE